MINGLKLLTGKVLTITSDNGSEFAKHETIAKQLKTDFYFTHVTPSLLNKMMKKLNTGPRKTLGFITPSEVFLRSK